ncbi:MAG: hypothetical protein ACFE7E_07135 [Candidatus Hodarchaeota archaeon]
MDIQTVSILVAAISVVIGVIFTVFELRTASNQRRTELLMSVHSRFASEEFANAWEKIRTRETKNYSEYARKYGFSEVIQVSSIFEALGYLIHRGLIDKDFVCDVISESTMMTWEKVKPMIDDAREKLGERGLGEYVPVFKWWEYIYNEVKKSCTSYHTRTQ